MKTYAAFQYFDNAYSVGQKAIDDDSSIGKAGRFSAEGAEGYSVALGVGVPAFGGTAKAHVGYLSAEDTAESDNTLDRWNISVGYDYNLSKRTSVYTAATYLQDKLEYKAKEDRDPSAVEVMAGLIHRF